MSEALVLQPNALDLGLVTSEQDMAIEAVTASYEQVMSTNNEAREHSRFDKVVNSVKRGGAVLLGTASLMGIGVEAASADTTSPANLPASVTATFNTETSSSSVKVSDIATNKVTILANFKAKGIPKKQLKKLEKNGDCQTFDGTKVEIDTAGHDTNNMTEYGRDYRTSEFCKVAGRWIRAKCGNPAFIKEKPPVPVVQDVMWVKTFTKENVKLHAEATALATCNVNGASASGYGHGVADSKGSISLRSFIKGVEHGDSNSEAVKLYASANGKAAASAEATANCTGSTATIVEQPVTPVTPVPAPTPTCPAGENLENVNGTEECVIPKDGTQGPGAGIPTQPGGPSAGGQPGNPTIGETCIDPADTTDGDMNPATSGDVMSGTHDQFGYCVGQAQPLS